VNTTEYLDPELLPFTAEELFRGLALATDDQKAGHSPMLCSRRWPWCRTTCGSAWTRTSALSGKACGGRSSTTHYAAKGFRVAPILRSPPFERQMKRLRTA
jgi:hypothetical protein